MCLVSWPNCLFPFSFFFSIYKKKPKKNVSHLFFHCTVCGLNILLFVILPFHHVYPFLSWISLCVTVIELCNRNKFQFIDNRGSTFQFQCCLIKIAHDDKIEYCFRYYEWMNGKCNNGRLWLKLLVLLCLELGWWLELNCYDTYMIVYFSSFVYGYLVRFWWCKKVKKEIKKLESYTTIDHMAD